MPERHAARRAVVVGGSRGIGAATSLRLAREGWQVVVLSRDEEVGGRLVRRAADVGCRGVEWRFGDVTDARQMDSAFDRLREEGGVSACVVTAGRNLSAPLLRRTPTGWQRHDPEAWRELVDLNLTGTFNAARSAAPLLAEAGDSTLVLLSSCSRHGSAGQGAYSATKAAISSLARTWAFELGRLGIRVLAVAPGVVDGEALARRFTAEPMYRRYMQDLADHQALPGFVPEEEVASAVAFALESTSMTGTTLEIDAGGFPARLVRSSVRGR